MNAPKQDTYPVNSKGVAHEPSAVTRLATRDWPVDAILRTLHMTPRELGEAAQRGIAEEARHLQT